MLDILRDNAQSWFIKLLFGIIILAFIFAFSGAGGGGGDSVIAYVKGEPITVMDYERALANQDDTSVATRAQLLSYMARTELIRQLTTEHGIIISNAELQAYIRSLPNFQGENGTFNLTRYKAVVGNTEAFEEEARNELLKAKMGRFLALPAMPSEQEVRAIFDWQNEKTTVSFTLVPFANYLAQSVVDPDAVQAYYDDNQFLFQQPERSKLNLLLFTPDSLAGSAKITEEEIASYYEAFAANMVRPRSVAYREVIFPVGANPTQASVDDAAAQAAIILEELASGASFEALATTNARLGDMEPGSIKTMAVENLSPGLATALADLEVGGISQPAFTVDGLAIVKLVANEESRPLTIEEAREDIIRRLSEEQAAEMLDDKVEEAIAAISQGKDISGAAEAAGMELIATDAMTDVDFKALYSLTDDDVSIVFGQELNAVSSTPVRIPEGYLIAARTESLAAMTLPMEDVRAEITAKMILEEARRLADIDAQAILAGQNTDIELIESGPFTRSGPAPVPGANARLIEDAFATAEGEWLTAPYTVSEGFLVAKAGARDEPSEALWEEQRAGWLQTAGEITRRELNMSFQQHVFLKADEDGSIEVVRADLLQ